VHFGQAEPVTAGPFGRAPAALYWPGATRAFLVTGDGELDNGEWVTRIVTEIEGTRDTAVTTVFYWPPSIPVARTLRESRGVSWDLEAALLPAGQFGTPVASVNIRARNRSRRMRAVRIWGEFDPPPRKRRFVAPDAPESLGAPHVWAKGTSATTVAGWFGGGEPDSSATSTWRLPPGAEASIRILIPTYAVPASMLATIAAARHEDHVASLIARWTAMLDSGMTIAVPDWEVVSAYRTALGVLLGCTERHQGKLVPIGNPFQYRDVWLRDGTRSAVALALAGHSATARELVTGLLAYQWPHGPFLSQQGQLDGTGHVLWALDQVLLRPGPAPDIPVYADAAMAAWRWCEAQRASTQILGLDQGGLLPPSEPRDNELPHGRAQLVGTDAWAIAGYSGLGRLLEACGRENDARVVIRSRERYRARFRLALDSMTAPGIPPTWQGAGNDWGNLSVVYPCRVLEADDPRVAEMLARVHRESPEPGLVRYGVFDTVHTYLSADPAHAELLAGRPEQAVATLRALIRWRTPSGGSPEIFARDSLTHGDNLPPHATAAAALVTLIRNMLVFDDDDSLRLTLGVPQSWWRGASVRRAPTRWGRLDLALESSGSRRVWRWSPVPVPTVLTLPPGFELDGPPKPGTAVAWHSREVVVPPRAGTLTVKVRHAPRAGP